MTAEERIMLKARGRFIEELPNQLEAIQVELCRFSVSATESHNSICSILHQIKGAAGFFGFTDLVSEIKKFELVYKNNIPTDILKESDALEPIITTLRAIIQTGA
jgi:HPt (histidine-containing phosphotransfer) domain-containing protein